MTLYGQCPTCELNWFQDAVEKLESHDECRRCMYEAKLLGVACGRKGKWSDEVPGST